MTDQYLHQMCEQMYRMMAIQRERNELLKELIEVLKEQKKE